MLYLKNKIWLGSLLLLLCSTVYAEKNQTIEIKSQNLTMDKNKGVSHYQGDVLLTKGTLKIKADKITLFHQGQEITKALIFGEPADVTHHPDNEPQVHSQAKRMEYYVKNNQLLLLGNAFVDQGNRHFSGERIEYDTRQRQVTAGGKNPDNRGDGRVHVIIGPELN